MSSIVDMTLLIKDDIISIIAKQPNEINKSWCPSKKQMSSCCRRNSTYHNTLMRPDVLFFGLVSCWKLLEKYNLNPTIKKNIKIPQIWGTFLRRDMQLTRILFTEWAATSEIPVL